MDNLRGALRSFLDDDVSDIARILSLFSGNKRVGFQEISAVASGNVDDVLLTLWEWKLVIPVRSSQCSEWDFRILRSGPGEFYEMLNITKVLVNNGMETGNWDSAEAIRELFQTMGEPEWEKMPELVLCIRKGANHNIISGAGIAAASAQCGLRHKTGAMIAILKGAGIISPKLAAISSVAKSRSPLYEMNPSVYAER